MSELWDNPLFPIEERLEMARGGIAFRDRIIEKRDAEIAKLRAELNDFTTGYGELNEEVVRLRAFHDFFRDRCEGLFARFGMDAIDAYNAAAGGTK